MNVRFITADGYDIEAEAEPGQSIMEVALARNVPGIEAECGGCCTCCTCHAYIDERWTTELPVAGDDESMLLDFAWERQSSSRLTCQIPMTEALSGIVVTIPARQA